MVLPELFSLSLIRVSLVMANGWEESFFWIISRQSYVLRMRLDRGERGGDPKAGSGLSAILKKKQFRFCSLQLNYQAKSYQTDNVLKTCKPSIHRFSFPYCTHVLVLQTQKKSEKSICRCFVLAFLHLIDGTGKVLPIYYQGMANNLVIPVFPVILVILAFRSFRLSGHSSLQVIPAFGSFRLSCCPSNFGFTVILVIPGKSKI